ncbi:MAG: Fic family protein, partial [Prevotellaceae bacterium]|nr:Fic family protein [Prevotellaceae bacterium]
TYYSNHIAGNRLTRDQTRTIFENNAIGTTNGYVNVDDIFETTNHFRCIDMIIDRAGERLSEALIRDLHRMLKTGMSDSEACLPKELPHRITDLLAEYNDKKPKTFEDILDFHQRLDAIRPLWDGSGRVGRLIMFKECLANGFVPFIITDELKPFYAHGLQQWPVAKGDLMCICLTAQDRYKEELDYYGIKYSR